MQDVTAMSYFYPFCKLAEINSYSLLQLHISKIYFSTNNAAFKYRAENLDVSAHFSQPANMSVNYGEKPSDICAIQNETPSLLLYKMNIQNYSCILNTYATICQYPYLLWLNKLQLRCAQSV